MEIDFYLNYKNLIFFSQKLLLRELVYIFKIILIYLRPDLQNGATIRLVKIIAEDNKGNRRS